ncbi:hypothetical protein ACRALDRAFT_208210 [Sodiomyces alcalophilus JCM 7366]|uniref:uncharacterized protein n=1 Tax=Sodiomyces alcalophilus JCM 7366 TaxID=591952 RepID=UPI0039B56EBB
MLGGWRGGSIEVGVGLLRAQRLRLCELHDNHIASCIFKTSRRLFALFPAVTMKRTLDRRPESAKCMGEDQCE